jgi:hypothetical protein
MLLLNFVIQDFSLANQVLKECLVWQKLHEQNEDFCPQLPNGLEAFQEAHVLGNNELLGLISRLTMIGEEPDNL